MQKFLISAAALALMASAAFADCTPIDGGNETAFMPNNAEAACFFTAEGEGNRQYERGDPVFVSGGDGGGGGDGGSGSSGY